MASIIKSSQVRVVEQDAVNIGKNKDLKNNDLANSQEDSNNEYDQILDIAKKQAKDIVKNAILEAGTIKESVTRDAKEQIEKIKKDAYEEGYKLGEMEGHSQGQKSGYEEGFQKGYSEGKEESNLLIEQANDIKRGYLEEKEKTLNSIEKDVVNLVSSIVEKILNQKLEDDETIVNLVLKGLESLNSKDDIRIRVSKEDFEKVNDSKDKILSKVSLIENLKVDIDSNFKKGDCIIESSKGNVDVSIDTQIKNVEEELKNLLDSE